MPAVEGFRSPYDKTAGGLHHLGRMLDKIRLMQAGRLPPDYHRNYGLSIGLDGQLCGFLNMKFEDVEVRVKAGGTDGEIAEWIFCPRAPAHPHAGAGVERAFAEAWLERPRVRLPAENQAGGRHRKPPGLYVVRFD